MDLYRRRIIKKTKSKVTAVVVPDFYKPGTKLLKKGYRYTKGGVLESASGVIYSR